MRANVDLLMGDFVFFKKRPSTRPTPVHIEKYHLHIRICNSFIFLCRYTSRFINEALDIRFTLIFRLEQLEQNGHN